MIEYREEKSIQRITALVQGLVVQLVAAGLDVSSAAHEGYRYARELLHQQGVAPVTGMPLGAIILSRAMQSAGLHPGQQSAGKR